MHQSPIERYRQDLATEGFLPDAAQEMAVGHLQRLYEELLERDAGARSTGFLASLRYKLFGRKNVEPLKGLYFWGGVGRGKTYLMDNFYDALPFPNKMRTHFHRFMRGVHQELKKLKDQQDPLVIVASIIADKTQVICFDEFFVSDITDAMILANLLDALFERGVTLVATSNIMPDGLYKDGLQRARFLPAIDLLNRHTEIVNVDGGVDYRLRTLEQASLYHSPVDEASDKALGDFFVRLVPDPQSIKKDVALEIEGREILAKRVADDIVWFNFKALCDGPRSQNDYIELAKEYHAVIVDGVPFMGAHNDDQAKRFIYMVDEFYDRGVKLILSAEKPLYELYGEGRASFEFQRTTSRIQEMQSTEYLACEHKA